MKTIRKIMVDLDKGMAAFERTVLAASVMLMALLAIANVIGRNLFDHSLSFVSEVNQLLVILITFVGIGYGVRHGRHIRMSALYDQLGPRARKAFAVAITLGTSVLLFSLAVYAGRYLLDTYALGAVTPALRIPLYLMYIWVPIGLALGGLQYLLATIRNLASPGIHLSFQRPDHAEMDAHC